MYCPMCGEIPGPGPLRVREQPEMRPKKVDATDTPARRRPGPVRP